jgi:predicted SprT family Zn-dependent metalloprotease
MKLREIEEFAVELMDEYGLIEKGWTFKFDNAKVRFGCCNYTKRLITVSRNLAKINAEAEVLDTILHEIAHALTPGAEHGPVWKAKCIEVGARPQACYSGERVTRVPPKWTARCPKCDRLFRRHRLNKTLARNGGCCPCVGGYDPEYRLHWVENQDRAAA